MPADSSGALPWLSIVIPAHNGERWLGDALASLVAQGESGFECVLLDSSPGDGVGSLVDAYLPELDLRIYRRPDLVNWCAKANLGFAIARAPHVCLLHQDDYWLPGRAASIRAWLEDSPGAAMHLHPSYVVDRRGRRLGAWRCPLPTGEDPLPVELLLERLLVQNFIAVPAPVIRRDALLAVGGLDEALWYSGDWDLYLKLARRGPVVYHSDILTCFRIHAESLTMAGSRRIAEFEWQMRSVLEAHIDALPANRRDAVMAKARASICVNVCLAEASNGRVLQLLRGLATLFGLGPSGMREYLRDSRLIERVLPRLRDRCCGGL